MLNIREAEHAASKVNYIYKPSISLRETDKTDYCIDLLKDTGY